MSENEQAAVSGVVAWIEARLAEIEAAAKAGERFSDAKTGQPLRWRQGGPSRGSYVFSESGTLVVGAEAAGAATHIALNDPAAMLTMVSGLRAVVALHRRHDYGDESPPVCATCAPIEVIEGDALRECYLWPCPTLSHIAAALGYTATPEPTHQPPPEQAANESEMRG